MPNKKIVHRYEKSLRISVLNTNLRTLLKFAQLLVKLH
jgi:hypothetical protein